MKRNQYTLNIDCDRIAYSAAAAGEKKSILTSHPVLGENKFNTRTEMYGHYKKKEGGWLAEINKGRDSPYLPSEFEIKDHQEVKDISNILSTARVSINTILEQFNTSKYKLFLGKGQSFRVEMSTLLGYKQQRDDQLRPIALDAVKDYYLHKFNAELCEYYEADDAVVMASWKKKNTIVFAGDKDILGTGILAFNPDMAQLGIVDTNCFGKLYLDEKKKVKGWGRVWLYFQVLSEDDSDNYCANCFSDLKWGPMSAYKALVPCTTDVEALQALVDCFKLLYPEPKTIKGWRGDEILIDAIYVLNECWQMARMRRWHGDEFHVTSVLDRLKINY